VYLEDAPDGLLGTVRAWPEVEAASPLLFWVPALGLGPDRSVSRVVGMGAGEDAVETTVIDGRAPVGDDEILLSPKLADRLGVGVGDRVDAAFEEGDFSEEPGDWGEPFTLEVVGTGPVAVGDGTFERGSAMTDEGLAANLPPDLVGGLPLEQLANFILIDRAEGVTDAQIADRLAAAGVDFDPGDVDQQVLLENLVSVDRTSTESAPDLLALVMATFATGLLAYGLSTTVARNRADLAIARALGFTPRLVSRTARWAAFAFVGAALVVAVPVGLVIGRAAWRTFATGLGVVPDPTVYPNEIAAFVAASLVAAGLIATSAARWQSRSRPATALRAE
jgi:hypothetical protein